LKTARPERDELWDAEDDYDIETGFGSVDCVVPIDPSLLRPALGLAHASRRVSS